MAESHTQVCCNEAGGESMRWCKGVLKHIRYLKYVLRHKWFVFVACCRLGIPWRGLVHDLSKFSPAEWGAYAEHFYGSRNGGGSRSREKGEGDSGQRDTTGYYKPTNTGDDAFDLAWLHHAHSNDHHWQWWTQIEVGGGVEGFVVYPMSVAARKEMLADWKGAGKAQGKPNVKGWYLANRDKMVLHEETRQWVEKELGIG